MVEREPVEGVNIVGRMGLAKVYKLTSGVPLWTEYQCRGTKYRSNGGDILMKQVVRRIEHFAEMPLGKFNELIEEGSKDLHGVNVIMHPTKSMTPEWKPRGGQLLIIGWTYDVTTEERDFFDQLNAK